MYMCSPRLGYIFKAHKNMCRKSKLFFKNAKVTLSVTFYAYTAKPKKIINFGIQKETDGPTRT